MSPMWDILAQAKADVVLQGHQHQYERFASMTPDGTISDKDGIRSFVVDTGGAETHVHAAAGDLWRDALVTVARSRQVAFH